MSTADLHEARVRLENALFPLRQRAIVVGLFFAIAIACLIALATLVLGMWIDLTVPLPVWTRRMVLPLAVISAVAFTIAWMHHQRRLAEETKLAKRVDDVSGTGGRVLTGYELSSKPESAKPGLAQGLALMAAKDAEDVCLSVDEVKAVPSDNARYWWKVLGATAFCLAVFACFVPNMAWTQVQRILVPMESQLPYSPTTITVEPGDTKVIFGQDLEVLANISGPLVDDLELVLKYDDERIDVLPMLAETDEKWRTFLTRVTEPGQFFVRGGSARSKTHELQVTLTPQITNVKCTIQPPPYTQRGAYEGPIPDDGITGVAGTKVTIEVESNRPLNRGDMKIEAGKQSSAVTLTNVATSDSEVSRVSGTFEISESGSYAISVTDIDDIPSSESVEGVIKVLPDQAPVVRLLEPKPISLSTPDVNLPIVIAAEDDFGIANIQIFRGLNGSPGIPKQLEIIEPGPNQKLTSVLPLPKYGLQPGDEITLFARVEDNDPSGAKGAESPIATVRIISREQLAQIEMAKQGMDALLNKQRQVQRMMADLQQKLQEAKDAEEAATKAAEESGADSEAAKEAQAKANEAMAAATNAMKEAADSMKKMGEHELPVDVDKEMNEQIEKMAKGLEKAAERLEELREKMDSGEKLSKSEKQELDEIMEKLGAAKKEHQEKSMEPTEEMSKAFPLIADQKRFEQLARRQRSLAQRLESLQSGDMSDPATRRRADDLRREQQQLQVALSQLVEDIEAHTKQLPADPEFDKLRETASEFAKKLRSSQADPTMTSAQEEILADNPQQAAQQAAKAADILESFLSQCDAMGEGACKNCQASFNPSAPGQGQGAGNKLGNSIEQLLNSLGLGKGQSGRKPGMGAGMGPGGGYSMPQNTADNIGLYGGLPTQAASPRSGNGEKSDGGVASYGQGGAAANSGGGFEAASEASARGDASAGVPSVYREQVSDYFRTLADELGNQ